MTPNHTPASKNYPGMVRFITNDGRTFHALGDPDVIAEDVLTQINTILEGE